MNDELRYNISSHPLLEVKAVRFETTGYCQLVDTLTEWLWSGASGGFILGAPRVGKSWAARALKNQLKLRDGRVVPVFYMSIEDRDTKTLTEIPRQACLSNELTFKSRAIASALTYQFMNRVCDEQIEAGVQTAVLIVDEFDLLTPRQFNAFATFFNRMDGEKRSLMMVFIGNKAEAFELLGKMTGPQYKRIRKRFFKRYYEFRGLTSRQELIALMRQYDTLRFPENGPTYTQAFLPEAVDSGWRLASLGKDLWRLYAEIAKDCDIESWGLEEVVNTLNLLVTDLLPTYGWEDVEDDLLREALLQPHLTDDFLTTLVNVTGKRGKSP
ncbi:ATP-binding protein [Marinobacter salsuginis]|uniref:ATP-binding protein n=1 Tax=Marinobacter salsuginis TaxID=418719 RepID=UPI0027402A1D|nr:ATP-binding protein [Marinobacter salsuginis]